MGYRRVREKEEGRVKASNRIDEVTGRIRRNESEKVMRGRRNNTREKLEPRRSNGQRTKLRKEDKHEFCVLFTLYQTCEC
jgi:hypothetical protein